MEVIFLEAKPWVLFQDYMYKILFRIIHAKNKTSKLSVAIRRYMELEPVGI